MKGIRGPHVASEKYLLSNPLNTNQLSFQFSRIWETLFINHIRKILSPSPFYSSDSSLTAVAFNMDRTSPNLMKVNEGRQLKLQCTYCSVSPSDGAILSWYKEGVEITNDTRHVIRKDELGIPVAKHLLDEGLYMCVVTFKKQNISRFITVIVRKGNS